MSVTVPGTSTPISQTFDNTQNNATAQQIANAIAQANNDSTLFIATYSGSTTPTVPAGDVGELIVDGSPGYTNVTVPSSYSYVVTNNTTSNPITIHGTASTSIIGGDGTVTVIDPAVIALGNGNNIVALTPSDAPYTASMGDGDNTVYAGGSGTVSGGTGSNQLNAGYGTGSNLLIAQGTDDTVVAGLSGGITSVESSGSNTLVFGNSGAMTLTLTGAAATVAAGSGDATVSVGSAASSTILFGGSGTLAVDNGGSGTEIAGFTGTVSLSGSNSLVFDGFGSAGTVTDAGSNDTIVGGDNSSTVTATTGNSLVFGTTGSLDFVGGSAAATVIAGSGAISAQGGQGGVVFAAHADNTAETVTAGTGGATLFGANGSDVNLNGAGNVLYGGYSTSGEGETVNGASLSGAVDIYAGAGNDSLVGGTGSDTMVAGTGDDTMTGGAGNNLFGFFDGSAGGHYTITDFSSSDAVYLGGYGTAAAATAIANATSAGGSTTITLADNTTITFSGVSSASQLEGHIGSSAAVV